MYEPMNSLSVSHRTIVVLPAMWLLTSFFLSFLGSPLAGYHEDRQNAQHVQVSASLAVLTVRLGLSYPAFSPQG